MPCYPIYDEETDRHIGFMCGKNLHLKLCSQCGIYPADYLCDFPVGKMGTCDKLLCPRCAFKVKDNSDIHLCPEHTIIFKDNSDSFYLHSEIIKRRNLNK
jgi:hypothetical protein